MMTVNISDPFFFSSLGIVTDLNIEEKIAAIALEDKSGLCLIRFTNEDDIKKGDVLDLEARKPGLCSSILNQTQNKKITIQVLRTNITQHQIKRYF